jgi:succinyl-diaminopimelate desuccinylase
MRDVVEREEAIRFLQDLIRIDTTNPPGNEHRATEFLANRLQSLGLAVSVYTVAEGRSNLEFRLQGTGRKRLFFCGHLDTVSPGQLSAWTFPPHSGEIASNRIYGRGASDMKSGLAAMVLALESLHRENIRLDGDLVLLATAGEEVDSCGASHYLEHVGLDEVDAIVIGEPTDGKVVVGHKGALWLEIVTHGKTAHGSMPEQGINAIDQMVRIIGLLDRLKLEWKLHQPVLGSSSLAVTRINGGMQTNVIPDRCVLHVDIRTVPPQSHGDLIQELERQLRELQTGCPEFHAEVRPLLDRSTVLTDPESDIIRIALQILGRSVSDVCGVSYYTDGSVLNPNSQIPMLIYGPGDEKLAHQPNESVEIDAYLRSISFYKELAVCFLGRADATPSKETDALSLEQKGSC